MIFQFNPILKSLIWGGEKIAPFKGITTDQKKIGESWDLSGVTGNISVVNAGPYEGKNLQELLESLNENLVGKANYSRFGNEFPLLIKFIDAQDALSIQVHPDDTLSEVRHGKKGKTEMWYVVDATPGAKIRVGFSKEITPNEYEQHIKDNTILDVLQEYEAKKGDFFYLPAGRIHSIGAGCLIAEVQQTSDVTYRIYDFCRKDTEGNERELHTELSKDAIDFTHLSNYKGEYSLEKNKGIQLASCPYFTTHLYDLTEKKHLDYKELDSFVTVMCLEGAAQIMDESNDPVEVKQGETILVSANSHGLHIEPKGSVKLLTSYID